MEGEDPAVLLQNYQKFCKLIGLPANPSVAKNLNDEEKFPIKQLVIDDEYGPIGPGGSRALMTAIMGSGPGMKGGPYKLLESLRLWRSNLMCLTSAPFLTPGGNLLQCLMVQRFLTRRRRRSGKSCARRVPGGK